MCIVNGGLMLNSNDIVFNKVSTKLKILSIKSDANHTQTVGCNLTQTKYNFSI